MNRCLLRLLCVGSAIGLSCVSSCNLADSSSERPDEVGTARTELKRGPVTVEVQVTPQPARLSDEPVLTITIDAEAGVEVQTPPFADGIGDFLVRGFREPLPVIRNDREISRQVYTLEPTRTGSLLIDPIPIVFLDRRPQGDGKEHRMETEPLEVTVLSVVEGEVPSLDDLRDLADPVAVEGPPLIGAGLWIAIGASALLIAGAVIVLRRRRSRPDQPPSPYELAIRELGDLHRRDRADVKLFYVELTGIVRRFIEKTTGVQAAEQTTEEFLREISSSDHFGREDRSRLRGFLESADLVKFAAHLPSDDDVDEAFQRARDFVRPRLQEGELQS